ncbi:hypothetical protein A5648_09950 [Mycolicibacter sinensis]|uniref:Uncharacterized protein n=1 Tax=Mycolicibacter sinensis (strain JDM601) TaxID=875328 RepID=A0A1A3TP28_MYCSD|nr:hypothetical protein A5648_09950 [Mycolicibacter sinensis]
MTTSPLPPDEGSIPPPAPETPGAAPTGTSGVPPATGSRLTPAGRPGVSPGLMLWVGLAVLVVIIIVLIVLTA